MCGIIGAIASRDISGMLLEGLRRLEYRGYDSAGLATINQLGEMHCLRTVGKVQALINKTQEAPIPGFIGLAHTRWATHGRPEEKMRIHIYLSMNLLSSIMVLSKTIKSCDKSC